MKILSFTLAVLAFCAIARPVVNGNPIQEFKFNVDNYKTPIMEPNDSILGILVNILKVVQHSFQR